jgi:hypothetical protein
MVSPQAAARSNRVSASLILSWGPVSSSMRLKGVGRGLRNLPHGCLKHSASDIEMAARLTALIPPLNSRRDTCATCSVLTTLAQYRRRLLPVWHRPGDTLLAISLCVDSQLAYLPDDPRKLLRFTRIPKILSTSGMAGGPVAVLFYHIGRSLSLPPWS